MRAYSHNGIRGATDESKNDVEVPGWMKKVWQSHGLDGFANPVSLDEWSADEATRHELINVAVGNGEDTSQFRVAEDNRAVANEETGEVYRIVSDRYELIQNREVARALSDVLTDFNLQSDVFGEVRDYGSFINADLYFNDTLGQFHNPDTQDTMAFGIEIRASHDRRSSVRGRLITRDGYCRNTLRGISQTGWKGVNHYGSNDEGSDEQSTYDEMYELFAGLIFELNWYADAFVQDIERSETVTVDFDEEGFTPREFYDSWLENRAAESVKDAAAQRAFYRAGLISSPEADTPAEDVEMSVWAIVSGLTYALDHVSNMSDGNNRDRLHRDAKDALAAPERFVAQVRAAYEAEEDEEEESEDEVFEKAALTKREIEAIAD